MKLFLSFFLIISVELFSQTKSSFVNHFQFGNGKENFGEAGMVDVREKKYFDNYLDGKLFYPNLTIGFRLENSNPPEFGLSFKGVKKKYIELQDEIFSLKVGSLYSLYNRGLSLNLFENRILAFDTGIEGLNAKYEDGNLVAQILGGEIDFFDTATLYNENKRFENYFIESGMLNYSIDNLQIGSSFTFVKAKFPNQFERDYSDSFYVKLPEIYFKYQNSDFEFLVNYNLKSTKTSTDQNHLGSGFYSSISYSKNNFGLTFDWKDYRFGITDPINKLSNNRQTKALPFQNPPIVHKEHSSALLKRYPFVANFNDEVGFQIDLFFNYDEGTTFNFNSSVSSEHFEFLYDVYQNNFLRKKNGATYLPSLKNQRSPFWEIFFEVEHYYDYEKGSYIKTAIDKRDEIIYDPISFFAPTQPVKSITIPIEIQHMLSEVNSLKISSEHQLVKKYPAMKSFYNHLLLLQFAESPNYSIALTWETTTSDSEPNNEKNWGMIEFGFRLKNHNLMMAIGKQRGGQICSNGLCRQVNPFNGFRFGLTSVF